MTTTTTTTRRRMLLNHRRHPILIIFLFVCLVCVIQIGLFLNIGDQHDPATTSKTIGVLQSTNFDGDVVSAQQPNDYHHHHHHLQDQDDSSSVLLRGVVNEIAVAYPIIWKNGTSSISATQQQQQQQQYSKRQQQQQNRLYPWCLQQDYPQYSGGFLFHKLYKTGSSTAVGVHLRIAEKLGNRLFNNNDNDNNKSTSCVAYYTHPYALENHQSRRKKSRSFLWTIIRHPASRSMSSFYFYEARRILEKLQKDQKDGIQSLTTTPMLSLLIEYLEETKNVQFLQLRDHKYEKTPLKAKNGLLVRKNNNNNKDGNTTTTTSTTIGGLDLSTLKSWRDAAPIIHTQILKAYNFVAIVERWHESMVVLQLLLDLPIENNNNNDNHNHDDTATTTTSIGDTIVLPSKAAGGWSWDWRKGNPSCFQIPPKPSISTSSSSPPERSSSTNNNNNENLKILQEYLATNFTTNNYDFLLYQAANRSLDMTIDMLGRSKVERLVKQHKRLQRLVETKCQDKAIFPCSSTGEWQPQAIEDCYWRDMGCGHKCVDQVVLEEDDEEEEETQQQQR